jgi:Xaa-Pro aminopeptidase
LPVRIEDDVLITEDGHILLSEKIPKETEEIENLTGRQRY